MARRGVVDRALPARSQSRQRPKSARPREPSPIAAYAASVRAFSTCKTCASTHMR